MDHGLPFDEQPAPPKTDNYNAMNTVVVHKVTPSDGEERGLPHQTTTITASREGTATDTQNRNEEDVEKADDLSISSGKKLWIAIVLVLVIIVAILAGVLGSSSSDGSSSSSSSSTRAMPIEAPIPSPFPSETPSQAPTTLRARVEGILADYAPLDEETLEWLLQISTWEPDPSDPNYDYKWLERYAMALLFISTNGPSWVFGINNWMSDGDACGWFSLEQTQECPGPVTDIVLKLMGLQGSLPSAIFGLSALTKLDLARNQFTGSSLPDAIRNMKSLRFLDLASTGLSGSIPPTINTLTDLEYLYLNNNELTGRIPRFGEFPMANLKVLNLAGNQLTQRMPQWGNVTSLEDLQLQENRLEGTIPASIGQYTSLTRLSLNSNRLTGTIPETIVRLSNLEWLSLYENFLQGPVPPLPSSSKVGLNCFLGQCHSNITNAQAARCIIYNGC